MTGSPLEIREQDRAVISSGIAARRKPLARVKKKRDELRLGLLSDKPHDIGLLGWAIWHAPAAID